MREQSEEGEKTKESRSGLTYDAWENTPNLDSCDLLKLIQCEAHQPSFLSLIILATLITSAGVGRSATTPGKAMGECYPPIRPIMVS